MNLKNKFWDYKRPNIISILLFYNTFNKNNKLLKDKAKFEVQK